MTDGEILRFIRKEIERHINIILPGVTGDATVFKETIDNLFPGMPGIPERPVMHPFGLSSVAPKGTSAVNARMGDHVGNRLVIGHRDVNAPSDITHGESVLYDAYGGKIELKTNSIAIKKNEQELFEICIRLLTTVINARTNTLFGPQPLIPNPLGLPARETFELIREDLITMKGTDDAAE